MERVKFMECYYHPSVESTDVCAICGKSICKECGLEIAGKVYCKDCLEKIVGLSVKNTPQEEPVQEAPKPERQEPEEVQFSKIAEDSPYNIKESIKYEGGLESRYGENLQPEGSLYETIENIQTPQEPVQDIRQEYVQQEPVMEEVLRQPAGQARNEYDYVQRQAKLLLQMITFIQIIPINRKKPLPEERLKTNMKDIWMIYTLMKQKFH